MISHSVACCSVQMMHPLPYRSFFVSMRPSSVNCGSYCLCYWRSVQKAFSCASEFKTHLHFLFRQIQCIWPYAEVFDLWSWVLCKVVSMALFAFFSMQPCRPPFWPVPFVKDAFFFPQGVSLYRKSHVHRCVDLFGVLCSTDQSVCFVPVPCCLPCSYSSLAQFDVGMLFCYSGLL